MVVIVSSNTIAIIPAKNMSINSALRSISLTVQIFQIWYN